MRELKKNNYKIVDDDTVIVDVSTKTHPTAEMLIDLCDWNMLLRMGIGRVCSRKPPNARTSYAHTCLDGKMFALHRLLLPDSEMVDHLNHNGLDNRRSNIREANYSINSKNRTLSKRSKTGVSGVFRQKKKWRSQIGVDGKNVLLGLFNSLDEAIRVRRKAEELHGYTC
jgi:hypothetical protein